MNFAPFNTNYAPFVPEKPKHVKVYVETDMAQYALRSDDKSFDTMGLYRIIGKDIEPSFDNSGGITIRLFHTKPYIKNNRKIYKIDNYVVEAIFRLHSRS